MTIWLLELNRLLNSKKKFQRDSSKSDQFRKKGNNMNKKVSERKHSKRDKNKRFKCGLMLHNIKT